jgi:hypothetical protein
MLPFSHYCESTLKQHVGGRRLNNKEKVEMATCERLRMQESGFHRDGIFKLVPSRGNCINVLENLA